jgi:hypothetical protein
MAVIIDDEEFNAAKLGLGTLGQILLHLQRNNRLVLRLLIDGEAPDPAHIESVRSTGASDHIIYLETVDARQTALDSIALAQQRVAQADSFKEEAADLLRQNQWQPAMQKLAECLARWREAQQTVLAVSKYFSLNLERITVKGEALSISLHQFAVRLRDIQAALQSEDAVGLTDLLAYETADCGQWWGGAIDAIGALIPATLPVQSAA